MKQVKKAKFGWKSALRLAALIICGAVLGINVYMANAGSLVGDRLPMPFGYGAAVVLSGSMEPEFSTGDLIVVGREDAYELRDIVVYQDGSSLVVHRIIDINGDTLTTQGDANNAPDEPITLSDVKGKVLFWIPYAGTVVGFLKTPVGTICVIAAAIALVEVPRRREKQKDEAERDKILEEIKRLKEEQENQ